MMKIMMRNKGSIILIGFMGSGKTSIGKQIEKISGYKYKFIDTDDMITTAAGMSIPDIFTKYGEHYFRKLENQTVSNVACLHNHVVSTGGGIVLNKENMCLFRQNTGSSGYCSVIFYLSASAEQIYLRVGSDNNRPLLNAENKLERIKAILAERTELYLRYCDYVIDTDLLSVDESAEKIIRLFEDTK